MSNIIGTPEYWNKRTTDNLNDLKGMIFNDPRRELFWERVRDQLGLWIGLDSVDVCCGFGRFTMDTGVDFSEEMLKLAVQKRPKKTFVLSDIKEYVPEEVDVIYEINSLHSLGWTPEQFYEHFKGKADVIACLEADRFTIFQDYDR